MRKSCLNKLINWTSLFFFEKMLLFKFQKIKSLTVILNIFIRSMENLVMDLTSLKYLINVLLVTSTHGNDITCLKIIIVLKG